MKTPPSAALKRTETGGYADAIGSEYQLTPKECRQVREVLAKGPIYVSALADQCGISRMSPTKFNELCRYVSHLGEHTLEAEMVWKESRHGKKFVGWRLSEHGQKLLEIS